LIRLAKGGDKPGNCPVQGSLPQSPVQQSSGWKGFLPLALVAILAQLSQAKDLFGNLTRPIILAILNAFGAKAVDHGEYFAIGHLEVPWSRDCAGLNLIVILLAVAIWVNRHSPRGPGYWLRIGAMIPGAVVANVLRVFTIIGYRHFFYPQIESPQLHYFFGLLWLVPFALLAIPGDGRPRAAVIFELLHTAAVIALLAPMVDGPGGIVLSIAVVFSLAHCRFIPKLSAARCGFFAAWVGFAAAIIWFGVESFWMPWLLVCPLVADASWLFRPTGALLILASHPMFALVPGGKIVAGIAIGLAAWKQLSHSDHEPAPASAKPHWGDLAFTAAGALALALPFLSSGFFGMDTADLQPPEGLLKKEIPGSGFQIQLPGQSEDIGLFWYMPSGAQRHHTLKVCMKYRGIDLKPSGERESVMTDGNLWMREFFIQDGRLLDSHLDYVKSTVGPRKSPGVHLIFVAEKKSLSAQAFDETAESLAARLSGMKTGPVAPPIREPLLRQ